MAREGICGRPVSPSPSWALACLPLQHSGLVTSLILSLKGFKSHILVFPCHLGPFWTLTLKLLLGWAPLSVHSAIHLHSCFQRHSHFPNQSPLHLQCSGISVPAPSGPFTHSVLTRFPDSSPGCLAFGFVVISFSVRSSLLCLVALFPIHSFPGSLLICLPVKPAIAVR